MTFIMHALMHFQHTWNNETYSQQRAQTSEDFEVSTLPTSSEITIDWNLGMGKLFPKEKASRKWCAKYFIFETHSHPHNSWTMNATLCTGFQQQPYSPY